MAYNIYLAMLSVVPLCSGAPLNPRLQEFLTWFLDNQRTIDRSIESGSTVVEDTTADTTTESNFKSSTVDTTLINIASSTTTEHTTTTATLATFSLRGHDKPIFCKVHWPASRLSDIPVCYWTCRL